MYKIEVREVSSPQLDHSGKPVMISPMTINERLNKVLANMKDYGLSSLIIYADKEHGGNFEYLTGFIPRFEEALQVLNRDGSSYLILGNENANKVKFSLLKSQGIKCPLFSLANQPLDQGKSMEDYLKLAKIDDSQQIGLVDWKLIPQAEKLTTAVPTFIVQALDKLYGIDKLVNASHIYIDPGHGARVTNNANEIAHYEYGASLASDSIVQAMDKLQIGIQEQEIGHILQAQGQLPNVVTIAAFGDRFVHANIYPTDKALAQGDKVALTVSYKGGLSSRSGYAVTNLEELEARDLGYFDQVVVPYYSAYLYWLNHIRIGMDGDQFYQDFANFYPQDSFGWELNPGHLTADEEWLSTPFYPGSKAKVQSGMIFQVDFIPHQAGHQGVSAEATVAIANQALRQEIEEAYPELWQRILNRRAYLKDQLKIDLGEALLPMGSSLAYYRPFFLNPALALVKAE